MESSLMVLLKLDAVAPLGGGIWSGDWGDCCGGDCCFAAGEVCCVALCGGDCAGAARLAAAGAGWPGMGALAAILMTEVSSSSKRPGSLLLFT